MQYPARDTPHCPQNFWVDAFECPSGHLIVVSLMSSPSLKTALPSQGESTNFVLFARAATRSASWTAGGETHEETLDLRDRDGGVVDGPVLGHTARGA